MGHKNVPNIVSLSHCLEQLFSCILTVIYVKAKKRHVCDNASEKAIHCPIERRCDFFCLLPVGVCIDAYVTIRSYVLCVSTH